MNVWVSPRDTAGGLTEQDELQVARCLHCHERSIWLSEQMIHPDRSGIPLVNADLSEEIQDDYNEAADILRRSPRGAAALLRLAIQKVCVQLGLPGKNINEDIKALVAAGTIPALIQQSLDVVRVVGNNAVHPGELDMKDDQETALDLFRLVNLIAEVAITTPAKVQAMYDSLPEGAREAIGRRDGRAEGAPST